MFKRQVERCPPPRVWCCAGSGTGAAGEGVTATSAPMPLVTSSLQPHDDITFLLPPEHSSSRSGYPPGDPAVLTSPDGSFGPRPSLLSFRSKPSACAPTGWGRGWTRGGPPSTSVSDPGTPRTRSGGDPQRRSSGAAVPLRNQACASGECFLPRAPSPWPLGGGTCDCPQSPWALGFGSCPGWVAVSHGGAGPPHPLSASGHAWNVPQLRCLLSNQTKCGFSLAGDLACSGHCHSHTGPRLPRREGSPSASWGASGHRGAPGSQHLDRLLQDGQRLLLLLQQLLQARLQGLPRPAGWVPTERQTPGL